MHCLKVFWSNLLEAFKFEILFKIICLITPVYNFINGRLADKPTVLKPLS